MLINRAFRDLAHIYNSNSRAVDTSQEKSKPMDYSEMEFYLDELEDHKWYPELTSMHIKLKHNYLDKRTDLDKEEYFLFSDIVRNKIQSLPKVELNNREKLTRFIELLEKFPDSKIDLERLKKSHSKLRMNNYKVPDMHYPS